MMHNFIRRSFKRELLLRFLVVALLPLLISNVFMVLSFKEKIQRDYEKEATNQLISIEAEITSLFDEFQRISDDLSVNENVIETLYVKDSEVKKGLYLEIYNVTAKLREYAQFHLFSKGGICKYSTDNYTLGTQLPTYWGILRAAEEKPGKLIIRDVEEYTSKPQDVLLQAAQAITDWRGNCIGYIVIEMETKDFESLLFRLYNSMNNLMVVDHYWNPVYSTESTQKESIVPLLRKQLVSGNNFDKVVEDSRFYVTTVGDEDLFIVLEQREIFSGNITKTMYRISILMASVSLVFCIAVALGFSRNLTKPINKLIKAMNAVENGNLEVQMDLGRQDEIGRMSENFNRMTRELNDYMLSQVKQQQELNDANIARMQAQLNPHFLYNTLDTVKWVAKANHIPEIATLSSGLAKILRISISEDQFIHLKAEMSLVKSYVEIQRIRFSEKFEYKANMPQEYETCIVPKLVIQPLVENAIIHGLADRDSGHIHIDIEAKDDLLLISVSDDGCGMEEEIMEHLNSRDRDKLAGHLGFYNVDSIIRLYYGQEYGLHASGIATGGTKVTIRMPFRKDENDVKSTSSG